MKELHEKKDPALYQISYGRQESSSPTSKIDETPSPIKPYPLAVGAIDELTSEESDYGYENHGGPPENFLNFCQNNDLHESDMLQEKYTSPEGK